MATNTRIEQLKLEFRGTVVDALAGRGSTFFSNLKDEFRKRGLSDGEMDEIITKVWAGE